MHWSLSQPVSVRSSLAEGKEGHILDYLVSVGPSGLARGEFKCCPRDPVGKLFLEMICGLDYRCIPPESICV